MSSYTISLKAYSKIILHCCKYPHRELNGVVIGSVSKETQTVQIQDCIPLFHLGIGLTPMLEVALTQVQIYCNTKGLSIVGYYHANKRIEDTAVSDVAQCTATKIATNCEKACLLLVDNQKLTDQKNPALKLYVLKGDSGHTHWKEQSSALKLQDEHVLKVTSKLVENRMHEQLVDFDNHLDNLQLDWVNPDINQALPDQQPSSQD